MIIGVYGEKDSGKTTLVERLVRGLVKKDYRVGTIKHIHYDDFSVDTEGRDTWKHKNSGASIVVSSAPNETAFIFKCGLEYDILEYIESNVRKDHVVVRVNNKKIPLSKFPEDMVKNTILGLISSLKGAGGLEEVEVKISV